MDKLLFGSELIDFFYRGKYRNVIFFASLVIILIAIPFSLSSDKKYKEFIVAINSGDLDKVKTLVEKNPGFVNKKKYHKRGSKRDLTRRLDEVGLSPLQMAVEKGHVEIARYLISQGAEVNKKDPERGRTALHFAALAKENNLELARLLIGNGADPKAKDNDGRTPLMLARGTTHKDLVKYLEDGQ